VIYIHIPDVRVLFLVDVYDKSESDDLSSAEKSALKRLGTMFVQELKARHSGGNL
jgi:hypothetical protein